MNDLYRSLLSTWQDQVYSLARYLLADASEAEDVTQETWVKLWLNLNKINTEQAGAWLLKVTRNNCLDRLRLRKPTVDVEEEELFSPEHQEPAVEMLRMRMQKQLMTAIQSMEEPWRSLLILRDIHEHSYESVGQILDLKPAQVKVYLHRARNSLSEIFKRQISNQQRSDQQKEQLLQEHAKQ